MVESLWLASYLIAAVVLMMFGAHRFMTLFRFFRHTARPMPPVPAWPPETLPPVTVQLPVYNERFVVERLIDAAARLAYPRDRLEIQVLDDSTDDSREVAAAAVAAWRERGVNIQHIVRPHREGFKAGALAHGLASAQGEFIAVFDADFVPPPDFLINTLPPFQDPGVGMVQTRWGHLNADLSSLTRSQAIMLDAHFLLEQFARHRSGCFFNFNGTAGVWRRRAIVEAGGWQHDTLTEDLDLSYRAQMHGWRFVYLPDVVTPSELPVDIDAFKSQQHRWAKGTVQTFLKLGPSILRSPLPFYVKLEAFLHLGNYFAYPFILAFCLLSSPHMSMTVFANAPSWMWLHIPFFLMCWTSLFAFFAVAAHRARLPWRVALTSFPAVLAVGSGIAVNNSRAILEALLDWPSPFERTPKLGLTDAQRQRPARSTYRAARTGVFWVETFFAGLSLYFLSAAVACGNVGLALFLTVFVAGFGYMLLHGRFSLRLRPLNPLAARTENLQSTS